MSLRETSSVVTNYETKIVTPLSSPCRLGRACCDTCPIRLVATWGGFLGDVRSDSPSRSITFLVLRVAVILRSNGRIGSYVMRQAWSPTIRAYF